MSFFGGDIVLAALYFIVYVFYLALGRFTLKTGDNDDVAFIEQLMDFFGGDGLVDCPPGQPIKKGDLVKYIPFDALLT